MGWFSDLFDINKWQELLLDIYLASFPSPVKHGDDRGNFIFGYMPMNWLYGWGGGDHIVGVGVLYNEIHGGSGGDDLVGTSSIRNVIYGDEDDDRIFAGGGSNYLS